jgi:hypothetical protein
MTERAAKWGKSFYFSKCKVMHVGARNPCHAYTMERVQLSATKEERDIRVTVSNNLRPDHSVQKQLKQPQPCWAI